MSIKKKILAMTIGPVLILGLISVTFTLTRVKSAMIDEIQDALKGTAAATLAAYDQNAGDYIQASNGDIWKGSYNISKSESLVDGIKENTGMDVTFFYGSRRIMTSAMDENGDRLLGSPAGEIIIENVLNKGESYFSRHVSLNGTLNYGYFMPVYQNGSNTDIVGMIFVGTDKAQKNAVISHIMLTIGAAVCVVMIICAGVGIKMSSTMSRSIRTSIGVVEKVAGGNLDVWVDDKLLNRKDEIGDLSKVTITLRDAMKTVIRDISTNANALLDAGTDLKSVADKTNGTMEQVRSAVTMIVDNSSEQAKNSRNTSEHMKIMGENITETSGEVDLLDTNAASMQQSSEKASETLEKLRTINGDVERIINDVKEQTIRTNNSVQKIQDATSFISSIAEETNLLSLNASIEAARAGESGRGFAVVAGQIKKLAEQSNTSSQEIDDTARILMEDSTKAVELMKQMQDIMANQSASMKETQDVVADVLAEIESSMKSIELIKTSTHKLEASRNQVVSAVDELSEIAQNNVEGTKKTHQETEEVADTFRQVSDSAEKLREIAGQLADSIDYFKI
ncbi:MAG: methyl-accepting chemotaxis protein [Clostridia bacterium]|nr:methyl-accepting chemotaxis protein [[Bacteroides] pectinophilus]MDD5873273.1 methyl-accepting chemotaxis protein [Clostridia bacterium]